MARRPQPKKSPPLPTPIRTLDQVAQDALRQPAERFLYRATKLLGVPVPHWVITHAVAFGVPALVTAGFLYLPHEVVSAACAHAGQFIGDRLCDSS